MKPAPDPNAAAARAAIAEYMAQVRGETTVPQPPADLLDRVFKQWPDMEPYRLTAKIERLYHERGWCWCVTVDV